MRKLSVLFILLLNSVAHADPQGLEPIRDIKDNGLPLWSQYSLKDLKAINESSWASRRAKLEKEAARVKVCEGMHGDDLPLCNYAIYEGASITSSKETVKHWLTYALKMSDPDDQKKLVEKASELGAKRMTEAAYDELLNETYVIE